MKKFFNIQISEVMEEKDFDAKHFQQSLFWGEFKSRHGWELKRFNISWAFTGEIPGEIGVVSHSDVVSVMVRAFGKGLFSMAYVPLYPALPFPVENVSPQDQTVEFASFLNEIALSLKPYLPKNTICVRFDPSVGFDTPNERDEFNLGMKLVSYADRLKVRKSNVDIQPPDSTQIDLRPDEDEILSKMKSKWRYNIRLAEKKGVEIEKISGKSIGMYEKTDIVNLKMSEKSDTKSIGVPEEKDAENLDLYEEDIKSLAMYKKVDVKNLGAKNGTSMYDNVDDKKSILSKKLDIFYDLYKITAERDGIAIHPKSYYEDLLCGDRVAFSAFSESGDSEAATTESEMEGGGGELVTLYLAKHENDYLGAIITLFTKSESIYLYGCSSNVKRNLMPNFLLQWTAMKDAKSFGSECYDMYGMPPTDDENHPMHGLYLFKTGFGGKNIHRIGSWDVRLSPLYKAAVFLERVRAWYHKKFLKRIRGR